MSDDLYQELTGNPGELRQRAQQYARVAESITQSTTALQALATQSESACQAVIEIEEWSSELKDKIAKTAALYKGAGAALNTYAEELQFAMNVANPAAQRIRELTRELGDLEAVLTRAKARYDSAMRDYQDAPGEAPEEYRVMLKRRDEWRRASGAVEPKNQEIWYQQRMWVNEDGWGGGKEQKDRAVAVACNAFQSAFETSGPARQSAVDSSVQVRWQDLIDAANSGTMTDEQWKFLIDTMNSEDGPAKDWFAVTFFNSVSPQALGRIVANLSAGYETDLRQLGLLYHNQGAAAAQEWIHRINSDYESRIAALGLLLGTASRSGCPTLRVGYADDVVEVFTNSKDQRLPSALSLVLSYGTYDTGFATTIADRVYEYERSGGFSGWGGAYSAYVVVPGGAHRTDVMSGVMAMLGNSPDAAQQFFTTGGMVTVTVGDQQVEVSEKMQYLLTERSWDTYWSGSISDAGDGLGKALEAATTTYRNQDTTGQTSAELTTQLYVLVGERTIQPDDWEMPTGMRDEMAEIVSSYMVDLFTAQDNPSVGDFTGGLSRTDESRFPGFPPGAKFTKEQMDAILQTVGKDPDNMVILGAGWALANQAYLGHQFEVDYATPNARANALNGISDGFLMADIQMGAEVLDRLMDQAFEGNESDKAKEGARKEMEKLILDLAASLPILGLGKLVGLGAGMEAGEVAIEAGQNAAEVSKAAAEASKAAEDATNKWASWAFDQGKKYALDLAHEYIDGSGSAEAKEKVLAGFSNDMGTNAVNMAIQAMYSSGFWDDDTIARANELNGSTGVMTAPPPEAFVDGKLDVTSGAYKEWKRDHSGTGASVQTNVSAVYRDRLE